MNSFYEHHKDSIGWHYRCFDRILLNGLIQPFQQPERVVGFFNTYRQLYPMSRNTLRGIAEQFQAWLKAWAGKRSIPVMEAPQGRRDDFVDSHFHKAKPDEVVAILKAREPARIMTAVGNNKTNRWHLQIANRWVVQYNFYINDRRWGPMFVRICPYLPFSARSRSAGTINLRPKVAGAADALLHRERARGGRLSTSLVLLADRVLRQSHLSSPSSTGQARGTTVGRQSNNRPTQQDHHDLRSQDQQTSSQTEIEDMNLPNPVIRSHYGNGFIKQYVRDHLILRTEPASDNVHDYGVNKSIQNLPALRNALSAIIDNYLNVQQDILETFVDRGQLRRLTEPTITPTGRRIPGLRLDHPRQFALMHALVRFAHVAAGNTFTTAEIHPYVIKALGCPSDRYTLASLRYDLSKLRAKGLVAKLPNSRRYQLLPHGYSLCLVFLRNEPREPVPAVPWNSESRTWNSGTP
jgi:hypothetical protein